MDMTQAVQNARTSNDHEALAKHYEDVARDFREKAEERKKRLVGYEAIAARENPFRSRIAKRDSTYSKEAPSLISHCRNLVQLYEQAAAQNTAMAKAHRDIAAGID
jgi:seryl-tRNA synthetase